MQENEFEKKLRIKMDELQLVPGEDVWKKVSANIRKENRRKRFLIFLFAFIFLAGVGGYFVYVNSFKTQSSLASENNTNSAENSFHKKGGDFIDSKANKSLTGLSHDATDTVSQKQVAAIENKDVANRSNILSGDNKKDMETKSISRSSFTSGLAEKIKNPDKEFNTKKVIAVNSSEKDNNRFKQPQQPLVQQSMPVEKAATNETNSLKENSVEKQIAEVKKDSSKPLATENMLAKKVKIQSNKKWNIGFTVIAGVSNNLSGFSLFPAGNAYASYTNNPSNNPGNNPNSNGSGSSSPSISKLTYKNSFSYGVGFYVKRKLSKKISFSAGANYHFLSAVSFVGGKNDSTQTFYDLNLQNSSTVGTYYRPGQSRSYNNKYYLIELPLNILIQLNKNQNHAILLTAGITPGYLAGSNALYANYNQNVYYADNTQFKKLFLSAETGVQFTIKNAKHFDITTGPEVQYGFSNLAKPATGTNQHLFTAGIKVNITLQ